MRNGAPLGAHGAHFGSQLGHPARDVLSGCNHRLAQVAETGQLGPQVRLPTGYPLYPPRSSHDEAYRASYIRNNTAAAGSMGGGYRPVTSMPPPHVRNFSRPERIGEARNAPVLEQFPEFSQDLANIDAGLQLNPPIALPTSNGRVIVRPPPALQRPDLRRPNPRTGEQQVPNNLPRPQQPSRRLSLRGKLRAPSAFDNSGS
jgi:hypothetical protein